MIEELKYEHHEVSDLNLLHKIEVTWFWDQIFNQNAYDHKILDLLDFSKISWDIFIHDFDNKMYWQSSDGYN